ncbi:phosphatidate cytidylyltransferase [Vicingaceae bacterium]|nr:phosphatidate cytidylyltransferase [Vicingaceae bacterium]MDA9782889.1 phosphatidate cytidylyltransferase [Vicingaceae bacterium]MDB4061771.1 phosphatidate cytidylyltransferase [Vicingaceae bacterium]MDB4082774.1 phosphatidate cytidylyltransferase [Vicingaceae bacterium]MDC1451785.1 phosphatidate cytidylyltransferase [Vicingaceae bacterium]
MSNFNERLLTGVLFVVVLLSSIYQSELASSILFFVIILLCQREFYTFFKAGDVKPQSLVGVIGGLGFFLASVVASQTHLTFNTLFLIVPLIFIVFIFELFRNRKDPIANIGYTILGIIYIAVPFTLLHQISYYTDFQFGDTYNYEVLIGYFFILWANDTGAYLVGRKFGRRKLFERISPKKTWEGSLGGVFFGLLLGYVNSQLFEGLDTITWMILAVIVVVFGSLGDLVESLFKRSLGIKDSGKILPGHGGVLDRFDGIFISAPMVYTFLKILSIW